jgi:predicted Zn-dependent peptidase
MGAAVNTLSAADTIANAKKVLESLAGTPATAAELERAKTELVNETAVMTSKSDALPDPWLDADTYRLSAVQDQLSLLRGVSAADIQRVASRLFKDPAIASVLAGDSAQLKPSLQGRFQFEVLGEIAVPAASPKPPTKPASSVSPG